MIKPVVARDVRRAVVEKGFVAATDNLSRDHEMYFFFLDGKKTNAYVKLSHGATELRRDEIRNNARVLHITGDELYRIVCCDFDAVRTREVIEAGLARE